MPGRTRPPTATRSGHPVLIEAAPGAGLGAGSNCKDLRLEDLVRFENFPAVVGTEPLVGEWQPGSREGDRRRVEFADGNYLAEEVLVDSPERFRYMIWGFTQPAVIRGAARCRGVHLYGRERRNQADLEVHLPPDGRDPSARREVVPRFDDVADDARDAGSDARRRRGVALKAAGVRAARSGSEPLAASGVCRARSAQETQSGS